MKITLSPVRMDRSLEIVKSGDALTVNGQLFDFSPLREGQVLPRRAIQCDLIAGDVERVNGELIIPFVLPHGPDPKDHVAFPEPLVDVPDGNVELPQ